MSDTIFAPATAAGRAAVAVVRLSGPQTALAVRRLAGRLPAARTATLRRLTVEGEPIDQALVLWFPGPASYTGEDAAEFHVHGGGAVLEALTAALTCLGLRQAEPGEFTRRAFEGGKLDLAQAEAVADLVDAETVAQRRQALRQLDGALGEVQARWRDALVEALALLEAAIDFPDEDLPADLAARVRPGLDRLVGDLTEALSGVARGRQVREGYRVALIGAPNAGKSTWFNHLLGRDAAIVTPTPGTTRDIIEARLDLAGYRVLLADTAGLRDTAEPIEAEGVRRARAWAQDADLRIWVIDGAEARCEWDGLVKAGDLALINKADLASAQGVAEWRAGAAKAGLEVVVGSGLGSDSAVLTAAIEARVIAAGSGAFPAGTRQRHAEALRTALSHVEEARGALSPELAAEDLRLAARALDRIAGRIGSEDILDRVFASFCIGK